MIQASARVEGFRPAAVHEMLARGREMESAGRDVVYMVQGEPDFVTPSGIQQAIFIAAQNGNTHYTPAAGIRELRQRLAEHVATTNRLPVTSGEEVIVTTGAAQGLFIAIMAVINEGDEVLLVEPGYISTYQKTIKMAGGVARSVRSPYEGGRFPLDLDAIENAMSPRTRALILNTPVNPTGTVYTRAELEALAELVLRHRLIVISDEAYERLVYEDNQHLSFGSIDPAVQNQTISVFTCSKTYAMTGWRAGYNVANRDVVKWMTAVHTVSARCAANPVQRALLEALDGASDADTRTMYQAYAARRLEVIEALGNLQGISLPTIEGTFYAFPRFGSGNTDSFAFAYQLLAEEAVVATPGAYYGGSGESHLRLSFAYEMSRVKEGLNRLERFWQRHQTQ